MTKFEKKCEKLGICQEVTSIMEECELFGENGSARIVELSKLRKWEIHEEILNYLGWTDANGEDIFIDDVKTTKSLIKRLEIDEEDIPELYALGICEGAGEIAYAINNDVILVLE